MLKRLKEAACVSILVTLILVLSATSMVHAVGVVATISGNFTGPIAYDSGKGEIFVAYFVPFVNEMGMHVSSLNSVSIISDRTNSVVANVTVGSTPSGIAYDSGKREIFVANEGTGTVSVISDNTNAVVATINLNGSPNYGGPTYIVYDSGKGEIFVDDYFSGLISVISDITNSVVETLSLGTNPAPFGLIYDSGKGEIFVTYEESAGITGGKPANFVSVISDAMDTVVATVNLNYSVCPFGAYDFSKGEVFVANTGNDSVSVISDKSNSVMAIVPVGNEPTGLAYDSGKGDIFVANNEGNTVSVISDTSNTVVANLTAGNNPYVMAYDSDRGEIFVVSSSSSSISVLSDSPLMSELPSPTVPEFSFQAIISVMAVGVVIVVAALSAFRKSLKAKPTSLPSEEET